MGWKTSYTPSSVARISSRLWLNQATLGFWECWEPAHPSWTLTLPYLHMPDLGSLQRHHRSIPPGVCLESWKKKKNHNSLIMMPLATLPGAWANRGRKPLCTSALLGTGRAANPTRTHTPVYSRSLPDIQVPLTTYPLPYSQSQTSLLPVCFSLLSSVIASVVPMLWHESPPLESSTQKASTSCGFNWNQIVSKTSTAYEDLLNDKKACWCLLSPHLGLLH